MQLHQEQGVAVTVACEVLALARSSYYRRSQRADESEVEAGPDSGRRMVAAASPTNCDARRMAWW